MKFNPNVVKKGDEFFYYYDLYTYIKQKGKERFIAIVEYVDKKGDVVIIKPKIIFLDTLEGMDEKSEETYPIDLHDLEDKKGIIDLIFTGE